MPLIAGHDIHVHSVGENGPPALMLHCMLARHEALLPLAQASSFTTKLFDLPGHGRSEDWDKAQEYQSLVARIAATLCDRPTHLIGHSFGGTVALRLAVERPELVERLTLIEPVYFAAAKGEDAHRVHAKAFRPFITAMLAGDEKKAAAVFNGLWGDKRWEELSPRRQSYLTQRIHLIVAGGAAIEEDADGITSAARLSEVAVPTALIRGSETPAVIAAIHGTLVDHIRGATDHVVAGAGHMVPVTHATDVAKIMRVEGPETG